MDRTVVAETERKLRVRVVLKYDDGEVIRKSLFDVEKGGGSVTIVDTAEGDEELSSVGKNTHDGWVERYDGWYANIGDCGGKIADNHYVANLAIETGSSLEEHEGQIAGVIGTIAGAAFGMRGGKIGTLIGGAIGGLAGIAIDSAFLKHYDLSGRTFTFQCWDIHPTIEEVRAGAFLSYEPTASTGRAAYTEYFPGHLGVGEKIVDYV
jgi:hypothetical protein